jgi:co-chaperonin GroES (HSP10)
MGQGEIKYKPLNKTFLVELEEVTEGGIILDKATLKKVEKEVTELNYEVVMKVSDDCELVKVGDKVVMSPYASPICFKIDGKAYAQVGENMIIGFRL